MLVVQPVLEMVYKYYGVGSVSQEEKLMRQYQELEPHGSGNLRITTDSLVTNAQEKGFESEWRRANYLSISECSKLLRKLIKEKNSCNCLSKIHR